jgi:hypothetical protein
VEESWRIAIYVTRSQAQYQALARCYSIHQECMTSSLPSVVRAPKPLRAQEVVELRLQKNAPPQASIGKVTLLTHSIEPRSCFQASHWHDVIVKVLRVKDLATDTAHLKLVKRIQHVP